MRSYRPSFWQQSSGRKETGDEQNVDDGDEIKSEKRIWGSFEFRRLGDEDAVVNLGS